MLEAILRVKYPSVFLNPKVSLALVNLFIQNAVKLSVIDTPESFNNFFIEKTFFLPLYRTNFIISGLGLPLFFGFPLLCVLSISFFVNFISILVSMTCIAKSSVFSLLFSGIPCINRQFLLDYYSCLSVSPVILSTFPFR